MLAGDNFIIKLAYDFYGNYTLQDLIQAASRLRAAVASLLKAKELTKAQADSASGKVNGQDYLGTARPTLYHQLLSLPGTMPVLVEVLGPLKKTLGYQTAMFRLFPLKISNA